MVKRRKIGLIYQYNENWIGGTYYIENLISALNKLPKDQKPKLIIFASNVNHFNILKSKTNYPFITRFSFNTSNVLIDRLINKIWRTFTGIDFYREYFYKKKLDLVFPADYEKFFIKQQNFLYWIPDFQEHFFPEFFSTIEIKTRIKYQKQIVQNARNIVFSSITTKKDFNLCYPESKLKEYVMPFSVTHSTLVIKENLLTYYNIPDFFFICSNQFWKHKNHVVILKALAELKKNGYYSFVVFTGKEHDYRNPEYYGELTDIAKELEVFENIKFLGFISRENQLGLMKKSVATIQPSLFEGWSSVVEDVKAIGKPIIVSNINVHQEQLQNYRYKDFFLPNDAVSLANCMLNASQKVDSLLKNDFEYHNDILACGECFMNIVEDINLMGSK